MTTPEKPQQLVQLMYKIEVLALQISTEKLKQCKEWKQQGEKKDEDNYTGTDGHILMSNWCNVQLYQLNVIEKLHKGHVITSSYFGVFLPSNGQSDTKSY